MVFVCFKCKHVYLSLFCLLNAIWKYFFFLGAHVFISGFLFKILFIYFQREEKGGRKRGGETSMCGCLSHIHPLGIEPAALGFTGAINSLSHTSQGSCQPLYGWVLRQCLTVPRRISLIPNLFLFHGYFSDMEDIHGIMVKGEYLGSKRICAGTQRCGCSAMYVCSRGLSFPLGAWEGQGLAWLQDAGMTVPSNYYVWGWVSPSPPQLLCSSIGIFWPRIYITTLNPPL